MRYLLISSLILFSACASQYKHLQQSTGDVSCIQKFKPDFTRSLYYTEVNVTGNYLSGLLLIKKMPDSSTRMVFSNQSGFKFFDFEFSSNGDFKVYYITDKLNKKPVILTLRKDFEIVMMQNKVMQNGFVKYDKDAALKYYGFPEEKGYNYYITDSTCNQLIRMERASSRKAVVKVIMQNFKDGVPDTIGISHTGFTFDIGLKRLENVTGE
jgi:hypothetical protein